MPTDTGAEPPDVVMLDTSAAIALVLEDHEAHAAMLAAVRGRTLGLAGHAWFEAYSVLTRLPAGLRRTPSDAHQILTQNFPASTHLGKAAAAELASELPKLHIAGGAVDDALVAAAARQHGRRLLSADAQARAIYDALGVEVELVG
jgi:predicted nucleic acid-binding protein